MKKQIESLFRSVTIAIFLLSAITASAQSLTAPQINNSKHSQTRQVVRFTKVSDFSIADSGGWSALYGDYIILKETSGPVGKFSMINVSNPSNPQRASATDSLTNRHLPPQFMIPIFIDSGVSNSFTNTHVVNLKDSRMLIAKDSTVEMVRFSGNILMRLESLTIHDSVHDGGNKNLNLMLFNDTLLGIQSSSIDHSQLHFKCVSLFSKAPWFPSPFVNIIQNIYSCPDCISFSYKKWYYERPYFHGAVGNKLFLSYDDWSHEFFESGNISKYYDSYSCQEYDIPTGTKSTIANTLPFANAFNTGHYLASGENICTSGFSFDNSFYPTAVPTELFVATVGDPWPYTTASTYSAIYRDTVHKQNQIQNIILDTLTKRVYLMFNNNMSILSYQHITVGTSAHADKPLSSQVLFILPNTFSSGVTIVLPDHSTSTGVDLSFYDLSGRCIERMRGVTSKAVFWKPKNTTTNCFIITATIDGSTCARKIVLR